MVDGKGKFTNELEKVNVLVRMEWKFVAFLLLIAVGENFYVVEMISSDI